MGVSYNPRIVTDGLVLCLDAGNKRSYPGAGTAWADLSNQNNNGTLVNGPTFDSANGGSILFDGTDDRCDTTSLDLDFHQDSCSVCMWVLLNSISAPEYFFTKHQSGDTNVSFTFWMFASNQLQIIRNYTTTNTSLTFTNYPAILEGNWKHLTVINDTPTNLNASSLSFYLDAVLQTPTTSDNGSGSSSPSVGTFSLAGRIFDNARQVNANIQGVQVYNKVLSEQEIRQNYKATKGRFEV